MKRLFKILLMMTMMTFFIILPVYSDSEPRIAIVGGGIGGATTAHYLRELFPDPTATVDLFEAHKVGGRLATTMIAGREYETGGSIIHPSNFYMKNFTSLLGLKSRTGTLELFGIYNGKEYIFKESPWFLMTQVKMLWRYGWSAIKFEPWISNMIDNFKNNKVIISTISTVVQSVNDLTEKYCVLDYIFLTTTFLNFTHYMSFLNFILGAVSSAGAGSKLWSVHGGNKRVPEELLKQAEVKVHNALVTEVVLQENGKFLMHISRLDLPKNQQLTNSSEYDIVIITVPLINGVSNIRFKGFTPDIHNLSGKYHHTVATLVHGRINHSALKLDSSSNIEVILTTNPELFFNSIGKQYPVDYTKGEKVPDVWKVFSKKPLSESDINYLFEKVEEKKVIDWSAYPHYTPPESLQPFILHQGLYYTSAIEWAASAMEMSAIAGRNVALLVHSNWHGVSSKIDQIISSGKEEL
ncbi:prenylcysteine oxidase 1-like [Limulus polyphemus]|uniref:Prenylcysteine oxidase 1-like n=1 Tax=Limulus polyphemus TaxID=6850 RepID=A0ABM1SW00_LIMPO|nr:prenylcysteine oxidase 1-like [Limulus polyphemus]